MGKEKKVILVSQKDPSGEGENIQRIYSGEGKKITREKEENDINIFR